MEFEYNDVVVRYSQFYLDVKLMCCAISFTVNNQYLHVLIHTTQYVLHYNPHVGSCMEIYLRSFVFIVITCNVHQLGSNYMY